MGNIDEIAKQLVGVEIGGYRIAKMIGCGGMGAVFLANHRSMNLRAAIKIMLPHGSPAGQAAPEDLQRFLDEARALCAVQHNGLVKLYDVGTLPDGTVYLQMELLEGESLDARLQRLGGRMELPTAVALARQVASALRVVHERGIIHRDLKPENIFLVADPDSPPCERAKILDFGLAKFRDAAVRRTRTGQPIGTPRYMSPEQCEGSQLVDERTDVYSLGLLLFQMAAGTSPYVVAEETPLAWLYAHVERRPRLLRQLLPEAPAELEALIMAMLDKVPAQRPSMAEVASQLRQLGYRLGLEASEELPVPLSSSGQLIRSRLTQSLDRLPVVAPSKPRLPVLGAAGLGLLGFVTMTVTFRAPLRASVRSLGRWAAATLAPGPTAAMQTVDDAVAASGAPEGMVLIRGQTFKMGSTKEEAEAAYQECTKYSKDCERHEFQRELPLRSVTLRSFYLDKYEVTNRQFAAWLNVHAREPEPHDDGRVFARSEIQLANYRPQDSKIVFRDGKYYARSGQEDLPATQLTWPAASQYCQSQGKQLPTEAQWEMAARGLLAQTAPSAWPWGTEPPRCDGVVMDRAPDGACQRPSPGPERVGTALQDVTASGVHDLGGNVHEWVQDRFVIPYPDCGTCVDPSAPDSEQGSQSLRYRVLRGGSYWFNATLTRAAWRNRKQELATSPTIGFRCAAAVR